MANFAEKFILQTDASGVALGAELSQECNGFLQPIAFASRTLSAQERKASCTYELECLACALRNREVPQIHRAPGIYPGN